MNALALLSTRRSRRRPLLLTLLVVGGVAASVAASAGDFPLRLDQYPVAEGRALGEVLVERVAIEPLNLVATVIFFLAVLHTFVAPKFLALAHHLEQRPAADHDRDGVVEAHEQPLSRKSFRSEILHFFGEVEAVFGIWALPLAAAIVLTKGWAAFESYFGHGVTFTEPMFVVVIMALAATRPVLDFAERTIGIAAGFGRRTPAAWWLAILSIGPLLASFITEPAAMVICALLLGRMVYELEPPTRLRYGTIGLLFVNVSIGGTLTHFAAPPVLMVAGKWGWGMKEMFLGFGWKAALAIAISNLLYFTYFRHDLRALRSRVGSPVEELRARAPRWITAAHLAFLGWTVLTAHTPGLFVGGWMFFLAFHQATAPHQGALSLRSPLLVGFFLAGLVIHGTLQQWWIAPVLGRLAEVPLFWGATFLTAFNDNAAITYLASLVPNFSDGMKHAVVAGAVTGGGLTVIANAPNPAGQAVLARYFPDGVSPLGLFLGALLPTLVAAAVFLGFR